MANKTYMLSESELSHLLRTAFTDGAYSHTKWLGQSDTCWTNVSLDMEEEVENMLKDLNNPIDILE